VRVQYTLPGMQTVMTRPTGAAGGAEAGPAATFKKRLKRLQTAIPLNWKRLLRLDQPALSASLIGPPPRPAALETFDPADLRLRWRGLIERHARAFSEVPIESLAAAGGVTTDAMRNVERMLALLMQLQDREDAIVSRHLAETRG